MESFNPREIVRYMYCLLGLACCISSFGGVGAELSTGSTSHAVTSSERFSHEVSLTFLVSVDPSCVLVCLYSLRCLDEDERYRPSAQELLQHPFVTPGAVMSPPPFDQALEAQREAKLGTFSIEWVWPVYQCCVL